MDIRFIKKETLDAIGDAIRNKTSKTELIPPEDMPTEIEGIAGEPLDKYFEGGYATVNLPNATKLKVNAFAGDTVLVNINMPNVTEIGNSAFSGCSNLAITKLPSGLTIIDDNAFKNCHKLAITEIPSSVMKIGRYAFTGCYGLTSITFKGTPTSIGVGYQEAFGSCINLTTINVPWAEGAVANAPWGATNATINYNYTGA